MVIMLVLCTPKEVTLQLQKLHMLLMQQTRCLKTGRKDIKGPNEVPVVQDPLRD